MKSDILNDICCRGARIYRTLNRPVLRSSFDADCHLSSSDTDSAPAVSIKVKGAPTVRLLDLILALAALKLFFSLVSAILRIIRR